MPFVVSELVSIKCLNYFLQTVFLLLLQSREYTTMNHLPKAIMTRKQYIPVFSLISQRTLKSAGFILWQFSVCFLQYTRSSCFKENIQIHKHDGYNMIHTGDWKDIFQTFFFFIWGLRPVKIISLIWCWANHKVGWKPEIPKKNHMTTRKQNLACPMWTELGLNPQWWDNERFRELKITYLNHSATGAALVMEQCTCPFYITFELGHYKTYKMTRCITETHTRQSVHPQSDQPLMSL